MKLIAPITRVTIANDEFMSGDGWLKFVSIELGEDARSSSCRFELADPGMEVAGKYFSISFKEGGIKVPADLLSAPPAQPQSPTVAGTGLKGVADAPVGQPLEVGAPKLGDRQWNDELLIRECLRQGVTNPRQIAYILATAYHETGAYSLAKEGGGPDYLSYLEFRDDLGNNAPGDGIKYAGRGYVQITGKTNYQKYQDLLGLPLIETPELIEQNAGLAAFTTVHGISTNIFTGNGSAQRAFESGGDFLAMSFLVNDYGALPDGGRALGLLLGYCEDYLGRLTSGDLAPLLQGAVPAAPATPPVSDATKPQTTPPATGESPPAQNPAPAKPEEVSQKGTEIIIELGYQLDQLISFHFIHVGTSTSGRSPGNTTFEGQCVRWLMARRTKNATYENVTLRQLAEIVCMSYGLELEMEGDGPTYQFLDQTGISDYQLLLREAQSIGYRITDDGIILKISPWRPKFTGFVITPDILDKISFTDRAKAEMQGAPATTTKTSEPDATAGEQKMAFDRETGQMVQVKPEDSTGTGDGMVATTGAAIAPMHGTVQETDDAPEEDTPAPDPETGTDSSPPENDPRENNAGGPRPPSSLAAQSNPFAEEKTGLPTQEIGAIDLADGKAEAIAIKDESRRVKGYESSASFKTTPEALTLAPGSIIAIAEECFDNDAAKEAFAREWRVGRVKHTLQGGSFRTDLDFYTPQAAKPAAAAGQPTVEGTGLKNAPTATGAAGTEIKGSMTPSAGGWIHPMSVTDGNNSCGYYCEYGYTREPGRWHDGVDYGGYGSDDIWSVKDGVVTQRVDDYSSGAGKIIKIQHTDGTGARYLHLLEILVSEGQSVKQGQMIAIRGGSGMGFLGRQIDGGGWNIHLHFETFDTSGSSVDPRSVTPDPPLP